MAQRISSIYRLVTIPRVYSGLQALLGSTRATRRFLDEVVRAAPGMKVLDVGCGPASLLPHLPKVDYTGVDINPNSIAHARTLYGGLGRFLVGDVSLGLPAGIADFDLIIVSALLHHLDDNHARGLFASLVHLLNPTGRIVTIDNVWLPDQNLIAWIVNRLDSGVNVRTPEAYVSLAADLPLHVEQRIYRDLLRIPYDHFCMTMTSDPARRERTTY